MGKENSFDVENQRDFRIVFEALNRVLKRRAQASRRLLLSFSKFESGSIRTTKSQLKS
jgi:hypothetical protein